MIIFTIILDPEPFKQIILDPASQHCDTDVINFLPLQTYSVFLMGLLILFFMVPVTTYQYCIHLLCNLFVIFLSM